MDSHLLQSDFLVEYCSHFIRDNLDGVLNFTKKSVLNQYLNAMLAKSMHHTCEETRDNRHHPFITDAITAGHKARSSFQRAWISSIEEWVTGCQELSRSPWVQEVLAVMRAREQEAESTRLAQRRERSSSLCNVEMDTPKGKARALSCSSEADNQQVCREGTLDKIINKTATMDLSTTELAQEKSTWLAKEIRGVRKKLSQISKLRESEAKSIVLTSDERAKLERRPVLEAELHIYQTALEEVEKRIHELLLESQEKSHAAKANDAVKEMEADVVLQKKEMALESKDDLDTDKGVALHSKFTCAVCSIKCPDKTSFELHQNGRKHRNRVAQVEEEEKQKAAQSIMAKKKFGPESMLKDPPPPVQPVIKNAWGNSNSPQPKYKLPPPPHPVVAQVPTPAITKNSNVSTPSHNLSSTADFPSIAREHVPKPKAKSTNQTTASPSSAVKAAATTPISNRSPFHLHPTPNRTQAPVPPNQRNAFSIGDFLAPKPPTTPTPKKGPAKTWTSPIEATKVASTKPKTLAEIQAEEADFKAREDRAYKGGDGKESSWFIERRERADSLHAIQEAAARERETQLMIQEQFEIEAQIKAELAAQQRKKNAPQQHKKNAPHEKKSRKRNNGNNKNIKGSEMNEGTNGQNG
jgi:hypothetical protein